ncbi:MAG: cobalt-precorrin-6A reductase [Phreatobacter sp.]|nr:cobalt-precorrin-6A reductase [Phreatobacter sp.]
MAMPPAEPNRPLLILGGTTEAAMLAARLAAAHPGIAATVSLAGRTQDPRPLALPMRIGGFGGAGGLADYLAASGTKAVIDATHPFAAVMPFNATEACRSAGIPLLALQRPEWVAKESDHWTRVATMAEAALALGDAPRRVFLTIGRQELPAFAAAPHHAYLARVIDPPNGPLPPNLTLLRHRGPFDTEAETELMRREKIGIVVAKNAGGEATIGKIIAARRLGLPLVMVSRPARPAMPTVATVEEAMDWLGAHGCLPTRRGV